MGDVIRLSDYQYPWREIFTFDGESSTTRVYVNTGSLEIEINQINDEGEVISSCMSPVDAACLYESLKKVFDSQASEKIHR